MSPITRVGVSILGILGVLVAVLALVFVVDRMTDGGEVLADVDVAGVSLGGLSERQALEEVRRLEDTLLTTAMPTIVGGHTFDLMPADIGFDVDETAIVDQALAIGRNGHLGSQFAWWAGQFTEDTVRLEIPYTYDGGALAATIERWEREGLADPPFPGDVWVEDRQIKYLYPRAGTGIQTDTAVAAIDAALADVSRAPVALQTRFIEPRLTAVDIDRVVAEARALVEDDVTLREDTLGKVVVIPQETLIGALAIRRDDEGEIPEFTMRFRAGTILEYVAGFRTYLETEPTDADLVVDVETDEVTIVPSTPVREPDPGQVPLVAWQAAHAATRSAPLPYRDGREADFSTADAEALGVKGLIAEFTTHHNCCENRVINIQLIADATDGAWIYPGEVFSLNEHVGQRTAAKGYLPAGAIIAGELKCCDHPINIGGGTSQWTTTLYNAVFFAGLEDVNHTPHSIYFSRYPEGREATLGWTEPDLEFRNNTENLVIIKATHTDTSITAKIYGDNGGLEVEAGLSDRYNYTGVRRVRRPNPDVPECTEDVVQTGSGGWSVDIYRYITHPDGSQTEEMWTWHYTGGFNIIEYNPDKPPDHPDCSEMPEE